MPRFIRTCDACGHPVSVVDGTLAPNGEWWCDMCHALACGGEVA